MIIGGVIHIHTASWFIEEITNNSINLDYEEHCKTCKNEYHDECWQDSPDDTLLIGYIKNPETGVYEPDKDAEYSAIVGEVYAQITLSKWQCRRALCSPCYPNQGDLDTPGNNETYSLPPDMYEEGVDTIPHIYKVDNQHLQEGYSK